MRRRHRRRLAEAMALLPAEEHEILFDAYVLRWTVERIASRLGVPGDVVKLRLHDALHRLRMAVPSAPPGMP